MASRQPSSLERPLTVAINAQLPSDGRTGGIQQNLIGLVKALGRLGGDVEYVLIVLPGDAEWLAPYLSPVQRTTTLESPAEAAFSVLRQAWRARSLTPLNDCWRWLSGRTLEGLGFVDKASLPRSYGRLERLGVEVIHFPEQSYIDSRIPSVFVPHDLLHLHYPEFFERRETERRERVYRAACARASVVVVEAHWVKQDLINHYELAPERIQVIPTAPPTAAYAEVNDLDEALPRLGVKRPYVLYPAVTWPHKNHIRLLEALALVRTRDRLSVSLICTGHRYERHSAAIEDCLSRLNLRELVSFLGFVSPADLRALYKGCLGLIMPSLFESVSGPVFEAWHEGAPVACASVTALPEQVGDAAILFDPTSVEMIADAIRRLALDAELRKRLSERGRRRLQDFSWDRTARAYRALYRRLSGRELESDERQLLDWDWMRDRKPDSPP